MSSRGVCASRDSFGSDLDFPIERPTSPRTPKTPRSPQPPFMRDYFEKVQRGNVNRVTLTVQPTTSTDYKADKPHAMICIWVNLTEKYIEQINGSFDEVVEIRNQIKLSFGIVFTHSSLPIHGEVHFVFDKLLVPFNKQKLRSKRFKRLAINRTNHQSQTFYYNTINE